MTNPMENELIRLRALEPDDVQVLYKWENDTEVWKVSNTIVPFSKYMLLQFIANQQRDIFETRQLRLIIESKQSGKPVGAIDLFDLDPYNCRAGVGILIYDKRDQGQGYASQALSSLSGTAFRCWDSTALLRYSFAQHLQSGAVQKQGVHGRRTEKGMDENHVGLAGRIYASIAKSPEMGINRAGLPRPHSVR